MRHVTIADVANRFPYTPIATLTALEQVQGGDEATLILDSAYTVTFKRIPELPT
jgi:hypothetical protein